MSMTERKKQAIRQYFERITHSHDKARGQLQEELIKLNAQIAQIGLNLQRRR